MSSAYARTHRGCFVAGRRGGRIDTLHTRDEGPQQRKADGSNDAEELT